MSTAFVSHPACLLHEMTPGHPECPDRLRAIQDQLVALGLMDFLQQHDAPRATQADLARVHSPRHVQRVCAASPESGLVGLDPDTFMGPATLEAALRAAGAVLHATDLVLGGGARNAFCSVRPPGHHAEHDEPMGFCFFNNVAAGVARALGRGVARVAVVDFDAHHGNGTEDIFADDPRVLICSSYQHPLYPYKARESVPGRLVNTPLEPGAGSTAFRAAVTGRWLPELERFQPQLVFVSAGFDAHAADPLAGLRLQDADFAWVTREIATIAARWSEGRIVSALEGGYDLDALGRCAALHVKGLMESGG